MIIEFFHQFVPPKSTFQQRNKNYVKTKNAKLANAIYQAVLEQHAPQKPLDGEIILEVTLIWPHTKKSKQKAIQRNLGLLPKTTKPDGINCMKGIEDIMTKLKYWNDDAIVYDEHVRRYYGVVPGMYVKVQSQEGEGEK